MQICTSTHWHVTILPIVWLVLSQDSGKERERGLPIAWLALRQDSVKERERERGTHTSIAIVQCRTTTLFTKWAIICPEPPILTGWCRDMKMLKLITDHMYNGRWICKHSKSFIFLLHNFQWLIYTLKKKRSEGGERMVEHSPQTLASEEKSHLFPVVSLNLIKL